jgi:hypothetical protein
MVIPEITNNESERSGTIKCKMFDKETEDAGTRGTRMMALHWIKPDEGGQQIPKDLAKAILRGNRVDISKNCSEGHRDKLEIDMGCVDQYWDSELALNEAKWRRWLIARVPIEDRKTLKLKGYNRVLSASDEMWLIFTMRSWRFESI